MSKKVKYQKRTEKIHAVYTAVEKEQIEQLMEDTGIRRIGDLILTLANLTDPANTCPKCGTQLIGDIPCPRNVIPSRTKVSRATKPYTFVNDGECHIVLDNTRYHWSEEDWETEPAENQPISKNTFNLFL